ncbi:MAG: hypothetical protein AB7S41_08895 [Parvibaculaceae bacterium]
MEALNFWLASRTIRGTAGVRAGADMRRADAVSEIQGIQVNSDWKRLREACGRMMNPRRTVGRDRLVISRLK